MLGTGEDSQDANPQSCSVPPWEVDDRRSRLVVLLSGQNMKSLTVDYYCGQRVWRVPCFLHSKDLFYRFRKRVGGLQPLQATKLFVPSQLFCGKQRSFLISIQFLYNIELVLVLTVAEILLIGRYAIKYQCKLCSVTSVFLSIMYHYRDIVFRFRLCREVFNVHTVNLSFICSALPTTNAYGLLLPDYAIFRSLCYK